MVYSNLSFKETGPEVYNNTGNIIRTGNPNTNPNVHVQYHGNTLDLGRKNGTENFDLLGLIS